MKTIKKVISGVLGTILSVFTICGAFDLYNKLTKDPVWRADMKKKLVKLNPFKK